MVALIATWALIGLILGATGYVLIPWSLALLGGVDMRDRIGRYFVGQMMTVLGDGALIAREQGGLDLAGVGFEPEFSADRVTVAGEDGHLSDDLNVKSRLAGKERISVGQTLILIAAFGIGSGMAILAARYGASPPSGGGSTIPIQIALEAL